MSDPSRRVDSALESADTTLLLTADMVPAGTPVQPQVSVSSSGGGPSRYGGYPPPRKSKLQIKVPKELQALLQKSEARIQYEQCVKRLALLELL